MHNMHLARKLRALKFVRNLGSYVLWYTYNKKQAQGAGGLVQAAWYPAHTI